MKKNQLTIITLFSIIISALLTPYSQAEINGEISFVSGQVLINGKVAQKGDIVTYGDKVTAGDNSACEILIRDNGIIRIQNNAEMIFQVTETDKSAVELLKGWFAAVFKKQRIQVHTPTSIAGIRGTALCIKAETKDNVVVCTCNGTIHWRKQGDDKEEVITAAHHSGKRYQRIDGKIVSDKQCASMYHTDKDIEELAAKIGVKIDWTKAE